MIVRSHLSNGVRVLTESMPHVRSVSIGVWLTRGSRHEDEDACGIAHFVEHMLFKGTTSRSAEDIAQAIDSIGGQLDAFTAKEYATYYVKVLDEHLPVAVDLLSDIVMNPAMKPSDVEREKKVVLEEIKMVEDTPDDLVHELFAQSFWQGHPLGRPILGTKETVEGLTAERLLDYFHRTYTAGDVVIVAAGNLEHTRVQDLLESAFSSLPRGGRHPDDVAPRAVPQVTIRSKEIEQSHVCLGTAAYPQAHADRYVVYVLNTLLGGSMSSRLFQTVREKRGLAYSVFSSLSSYRDAGSITIYAGCANEAVEEVIDLIVKEMRGLRSAAAPETELRRAKDHLKGNLMLSLENTASRMSNLARQQIYFGRHFSLDETLAGIEAVTSEAVLRVARALFSDGGLAAAVISQRDGWELGPSRLLLGDD